jgi:hypothetical protein
MLKRPALSLNATKAEKNVATGMLMVTQGEFRPKGGESGKGTASSKYNNNKYQRYQLPISIQYPS